MNHNYKEAEQLSTESSLIQEWTDGDRLIMATRAQAEATLALASEQARAADALEVANLIAYLNTAGLYRLAYPAPESVLKSVQAQVEVRMGLA